MGPPGDLGPGGPFESRWPPPGRNPGYVPGHRWIQRRIQNRLKVNQRSIMGLRTRKWHLFIPTSPPSSLNRPLKDGVRQNYLKASSNRKNNGRNRFLVSISCRILGLQMYPRIRYVTLISSLNRPLKDGARQNHIWYPRLRPDIDPRNGLRPLFLRSDEALRHFWCPRPLRDDLEMNEGM